MHLSDKYRPIREWSPGQIALKRYELVKAANARGWADVAEDLAQEALEEMLLRPEWTQKTGFLIYRAAQKYFGIVAEKKPDGKIRQRLAKRREIAKETLYFRKIRVAGDQEWYAELALALEALPVDQADVFASTAVLEESLKSYARGIGRPFTSTQKVLARAKEQLRQHFSQGPR
jgi:DNA-directed RNA polymerase specialized sigma24 family protein